MTNKEIHIVSFDIPDPPTYGGVIDVYYKIKCLHELGVKVNLHCFHYGRSLNNQLMSICNTVTYYKRRSGIGYLLNPLPYIVATRQSEQLAQNLLKDKHPILFEGLHCCFYLNDDRFKNRIKIVRAHNIEHDYYRGLANAETRFWKKRYYLSEARKLEKYEAILKYATKIIAVSDEDCKLFTAKYKNAELIPSFHPSNKVSIKGGIGNFVLYHGNLQVSENAQAAQFLIEEVFNDSKVKLIIAGNKPSNTLKKIAKKNSVVELKENLSTNEIYALLADAQINILPTFQPTGVKLKLLSALHMGRHCIVNSNMVAGTGLEQLCYVCNDAPAMKEKIALLMDKTIDTVTLERRELVLGKLFSNKLNAEKIVALI